MRGYITGTFDLLHDNHYRILKACKAQCDILTVGLVTDALGTLQKRTPILSYSHRRLQLEHSKYVDFVVEHRGDTKERAYEKLRFDILFSSDEYFSSPEHKAFSLAYPLVPCIYIPRNYDTSTTDIIAGVHQRFLDQVTVLTVGVGGNIFQFGHTILKYINLIAEDRNSCDIFGLFASGPLPRNWKGVPNQTPFPNITGINGNRELMINDFYRTKPWSNFISYRCVYTREKEEQTKPTDRSRPYKIFQLKMSYSGVPLAQFFLSETVSNAHRFQIITKVKHIITELRTDKIIHGDIHPNNVLINMDTFNLTLIDFGWAMSAQFSMCKCEQEKLELMLYHNFDWLHFQMSLKDNFIRLFRLTQEEEATFMQIIS